MKSSAGTVVFASVACLQIDQVLHWALGCWTAVCAGRIEVLAHLQSALLRNAAAAPPSLRCLHSCWLEACLLAVSDQNQAVAAAAVAAAAAIVAVELALAAAICIAELMSPLVTVCPDGRKVSLYQVAESSQCQAENLATAHLLAFLKTADCRLSEAASRPAGQGTAAGPAQHAVPAVAQAAAAANLNTHPDSAAVIGVEGLLAASWQAQVASASQQKASAGHRTAVVLASTGYQTFSYKTA